MSQRAVSNLWHNRVGGAKAISVKSTISLQAPNFTPKGGGGKIHKAASKRSNFFSIQNTRIALQTLSNNEVDMLRAWLIYLSKAGWAQNLVSKWSVARRVASRFVAGSELSDAIRVIKELNSQGIFVTLDHLGESTTNLNEAEQATQAIIDMLNAIDKENVQANASIKLTQIGLALDKERCEQNLRRILSVAKEHGIMVRIDMEDSPWVDATLDLYFKMRQEGLDNVGVVIQSYLRRAEADVRRLMEEGARVRLVKGAYKEPPEIAFPKKQDVDANYDRLTRMLIDGAKAHGAPLVSEDGKWPPIPAIGTHDEARIEYAKEYAQSVGLPKRAIEFQMLYGIRRDLQRALAKEGYPVRVYVPYGTEWYPYFMRRLAERPANLWFFISNLFRK